MKAVVAAALVNFLWEGAGIGALAWLGFAMSRSPRVRYLVGVAALALMAVAPVATGVVAARTAVVPGPSSPVPGPLSSQVLGAASGSAEPGRGTVDLSGPGTRDQGRWTLSSIPSLDPRVAAMVLAIWLLGVGVLSARLAFGWLGARRLTRRVMDAGANVQAVANRLIAQLKIRVAVRVVESALVQVPSVVGAFKPVVLLPAAAMSGLSMEQVEALLAHELAHVRRHDYLVNLLQSAMETLLFYHPAVWLVSRRVRQERELCCDDLALEVCSDRVAYASALADLETLRAMPSPALAANGGSLLTRIRRILGHEDFNALSGRSKSVAGIAILAVMVLLAGTQAARARGIPTVEELAKRISPGEQIEFPATWPAKSSDLAEIAQAKGAQGVVGGVADGIPGGVQGGVKGGVKGGVPESVPILVSATDDPTLKIIEDTDITVRVQSNGKPAKPFSDAPLHVGKDGFVTLPLIGHFQLAGKTLKEAATSIRGELIFKRFFPDPEVDVRANMEIVPAEPMAPDTYVIAVNDEVGVMVMSPILQPEFSAQPYKVRADGTIQLPHLSAPQKLAGQTIAQARVAIRKALINGQQYTNPTVDVQIASFASDVTKGAPPAQQQPSGPTLAIGQIVRLEVSVGQVRQAEFNKDYTVQPDGTIVVPYVGAVKAAGLTINAIAGAIADLLTKNNVLPGAKVVASIETRTTPPAPKSISVIVQGAVRAPGKLMLREDRNTIGDAISQGGGFQPNAGPRVFLQRAGTPDRTFSRTALVQGLATGDKIQDGDTIVVEFAPHFYVTGFVKNSQAEHSWEEGMTLGKAIALAGGVPPQGDINRANIRRKDPATGKFAEAKLANDAMATVIEPEDVINVPKGETDQTVSVTGQVKKPGTYTWEAGMTVEKAIALAGGMTQYAAVNRIKIRRKDPKTGELVDIKVDKLDVTVQPDDIIIVPDKYF